MSGTLNMNFDTVPVKVLPIPEGWYVLSVAEAPTVDALESGKGNMLTIQARVAEGDFMGRAVKAGIFLGNEFGQSAAKRFVLSCGADVKGKSGVDLAELIGCVFKGRVVVETFTPKGTSETAQVNKLKDFLVPGEEKTK
jgi:hypothetical protein